TVSPVGISVSPPQSLIASKEPGAAAGCIGNPFTLTPSANTLGTTKKPFAPSVSIPSTSSTDLDVPFAKAAVRTFGAPRKTPSGVAVADTHRVAFGGLGQPPPHESAAKVGSAKARARTTIRLEPITVRIANDLLVSGGGAPREVNRQVGPSSNRLHIALAL